MIKNLILVGLGGFIGSALRYLCSQLLLQNQVELPWPTFIVNIAGSFLIGILFALQLRDSNVNLLLITGFCGGFTTFSTFSLENLTLLQNGDYKTAAIYMFGSLFTGIITVLLGYTFIQKLIS